MIFHTKLRTFLGSRTIKLRSHAKSLSVYEDLYGAQGFQNGFSDSIQTTTTGRYARSRKVSNHSHFTLCGIVGGSNNDVMGLNISQILSQRVQPRAVVIKRPKVPRFNLATPRNILNVSRLKKRQQQRFGQRQIRKWAETWPIKSLLPILILYQRNFACNNFLLLLSQYYSKVSNKRTISIQLTSYYVFPKPQKTVCNLLFPLCTAVVSKLGG